MTLWSSRGVIIASLGAVTGLMSLAACVPNGTPGHSADHTRSHGPRRGYSGGRSGGNSAIQTGCLVTVHGVTYGPGLLLPTWLPAGFHKSAVTQAGSAMPTENYTLASDRPDPPRIELGFANYSGPFASFTGPASRHKLVAIQGHRGRLDSGPPTVRFISVYWKPDKVHLLSVTGYKLSAATVVTVANNIWFDPPGLVSLPVSAGHIVSRRVAINVAQRASDLAAAHTSAKLSSWAEVAALLQAGHAGNDVSQVPGAFATERWQPVWTVLVSDGLTGDAVVVVIDAVTGQPVVTAPTTPHPAWFRALTDRSRTVARRCQGGSRARLPFGVLTRNEESFVVSASQLSAGVSHASTSVRLKLTTVPAINSADAGLYGGCVEQSCSISELVWVVITTVRADPGTTVDCLPGSASYPAGYRPTRVTEYFAVSVPGNAGIYCHKLPAPITRLKDLAPPLTSKTSTRP
jgi:hypothetical protein